MRILRLKVRKNHAKVGRVGRRPDWLVDFSSKAPLNYLQNCITW